jgi:hypothetical protein
MFLPLPKILILCDMPTSSKKHFLFGSITLLLMALTACNSDKAGAGMYFYMPFADGKPQADTLLNFASYLELRTDGTYAQDFGRFDFGDWNLSGASLFLTNQRRRTYVYQLLRLTKDEMDLKLANGRTGHFSLHRLPSARPQKDPFSTFNNQWRIPAMHKENEAEIRQRLLNHCQFWEAFFTWVDDKDEGVVDIAEFPTPLKIYGNGFGLKHYDRLPAGWRSCFFDEEDCRKADTLIKHTFRKHDIAWPDTKDDYQKLIGGFQQLQQFLRP